MLEIAIFALSVPVYFMKTVSIRIFDLHKLGQRHELQRRRLCHWMAFFGLQDGEKMVDLSQAIFY